MNNLLPQKDDDTKPFNYLSTRTESEDRLTLIRPSLACWASSKTSVRALNHSIRQKAVCPSFPVALSSKPRRLKDLPTAEQRTFQGAAQQLTTDQGFSVKWSEVWGEMLCVLTN